MMLTIPASTIMADYHLTKDGEQKLIVSHIDVYISNINKDKPFTVRYLWNRKYRAEAMRIAALCDALQDTALLERDWEVDWYL